MRIRELAWSGLFALLPMMAAMAGPSVFSTKKQEPPLPVLPLQAIAAPHREVVRQILEKSTLSARGPSETFPGKSEVYRFFLDNPDRAVTAWRRLGAKCVSIQVRGNQKFSWADDNGSEVVWETVLRQPDLRVWLAEGKVKPNNVLPMVPVKAIVIVRHSEVAGTDGTPAIQQQTEMYIHTDSKTAVMVTKMLGPSAQRLAEQGLGQFQFFFSGLSFYLNRHPDQTDVLLREEQ